MYPSSMLWGFGGKIAGKSALRSAVIFLSRVRDHHRRPGLSWGLKVLRYRFYVLATFTKAQKKIRNAIKTSKSLPRADYDSTNIPDVCLFEMKFKKSKANPKLQMDPLKSDGKLGDTIAVAVQNKYETPNNISERLITIAVHGSKLKELTGQDGRTGIR
ncbi:hypothetical protein PoB_003729800 [Plakobranchus ocellatus]|uniref:Uncharacterized protein n=1 Tax=Plakobranchus ocellatus TaxID=259542 RepID=A0AAV4ATR8_9GAST|nr:hypothetical protein PoB_003729800 [Plakobranchus ocellatus]